MHTFLGFGFCLVMTSVFIGAGLEVIRKRDIAENGPIAQDVAGVVYNASSISVLAQIPQYFFMGSGEAFAAVTGARFV